MIINNCPAKNGENGCISSQTNNVECAKNKDCVMKRLVSEFPTVIKILEVKR